MKTHRFSIFRLIVSQSIGKIVIIPNLFNGSWHLGLNMNDKAVPTLGYFENLLYEKVQQ